MSDNRTHIRRDIGNGEIFRHEGDLVIHGNVGRGASIDIVDGGLKITGDVSDGATLRTRGDGDFSGIKIKGYTGSDVTLDSDKSVKLNDAGPHLRLRAGKAASFGHIAAGFNLHAMAEVNGGDVGQNAHLRSGGSCVIAQIGDGSIIEASGLLQVTFAGHDCRVSTGDAFHAAGVGADTVVNAGKGAFVGEAQRSAKISGHPARIRALKP